MSSIHPQRAIGWLAAGASALALLGAIAVVRPVSAARDPLPSQLTHSGSFEYSAPSSSPLYPDGFSTGDPVFTRLADRVTVEFTHQATGGYSDLPPGSMRLDAVLTGSGGWRQVLPLVAAAPLSHGPTTVRAVLDLPVLRALGNEAAAITGTSGGELGIAVTPAIEFPGSTSEAAAEDSFGPSLGFSLDATALRPRSPDGAGDTFTQTREVAAEPPSPHHAGAVGFLGGRFTVPDGRTAALFAGAALLFLAAGLGSMKVRRAGEPGAIEARYGQHLVPVEAVTYESDRTIANIPTMAHLVRIAKKTEQLVLHRIVDGRHDYLVIFAGTTFRYSTGSAHPGAA